MARADGHVEFLERSKQEGGGLWEQRAFEFEVPGLHQADRSCALDDRPREQNEQQQQRSQTPECQ